LAEGQNWRQIGDNSFTLQNLMHVARRVCLTRVE
jgi:hypothetical protein